MSINIARIPFRSPSTDGIAETQATFDIDQGPDTTGSAQGYFIRSTSGAKIDVSRAVWTAIYGKLLDAPKGLRKSFLSAKFTTGTALTVYDGETNLLAWFAANDPIAIIEDYSESTGLATVVKYRLVTTTAANTINVNADPGVTFLKGSMVVNLAGLESEFWLPLSLYEGIGAKAAAERPAIPSYTATNIATQKIQVVITNPNLSGDHKKAWYDCYVRANPWTYPHPGWIPDAADQTFSGATQDAATLTVDLTTYNGSTGALGDPDAPGTEGGAALALNTVYYVGVVRKDASGARQLTRPNESLVTVYRRLVLV